MNLLLAIGAARHGDDALGPVFARLFRRLSPPGWTVLDAGTAPELHTTAIRRLAPRRLVLLDACDMRLPPGEMRLLSPGATTALAFGTHAPDIRMLSTFLLHDLPLLDIRILAVQPARIAPSAPLAPPVRGALRRLARALANTPPDAPLPFLPYTPQPAPAP